MGATGMTFARIRTSYRLLISLGLGLLALPDFPALTIFCVLLGVGWARAGRGPWEALWWFLLFAQLFAQPRSYGNPWLAGFLAYGLVVLIPLESLLHLRMSRAGSEVIHVATRRTLLVIAVLAVVVFSSVWAVASWTPEWPGWLVILFALAAGAGVAWIGNRGEGRE